MATPAALLSLRRGSQGANIIHVMSSRHSPQPLGKLVKSIIDEMGIQSKIDEAQVVETWAALAGPNVNARTQSAWVKNKTLYVKINSSAWRQELQMRKKDWLERLNQELGRKLVEDIVFR